MKENCSRTVRRQLWRRRGRGLDKPALVSSAGYERTEAGMITDIYGNIHRDACAFSASEGGYAL